jgi:hypothetical protein
MVETAGMASWAAQHDDMTRASGEADFGAPPEDRYFEDYARLAAAGPFGGLIASGWHIGRIFRITWCLSRRTPLAAVHQFPPHACVWRVRHYVNEITTQ